jgi:tRNA threonylcarbamoyladenosine biosynthesis protein TsaE
VAAALAPLLRPGDLVLVEGPLGAGKTTFVRAAMRALGVTEPVTSPSYLIARRYRTAHGGWAAHLDLYRSSRLGEEEWGDLEPYFDEGPAFVEWPQAGAGVLPPARVTVAIEPLEGDARLVAVETYDTELLRSLDRSLA